MPTQHLLEGLLPLAALLHARQGAPVSALDYTPAPASAPAPMDGECLSPQTWEDFRSTLVFTLVVTVLHLSGTFFSAACFIAMSAVTTARRLRRNAVFFLLLAAILGSAFGSVFSAAHLYHLLATQDMQSMTLSVLSANTSPTVWFVLNLVPILADTSIIPRIMLLYPRDDPRLFRRGLLIITVPVLIKFVRLGLALTASLMSLLDPRQATINASLWLVTCVDEIACNAFICDKLHTLGWRRYDGSAGARGKASHDSQRLLHYLRTGFYTTLIASITPIVLALTMMILDFTHRGAFLTRACLFLAYTSTLIIASCFCAFWPAIQAGVHKRGHKTVPRLVFGFDVDLDRDLLGGPMIRGEHHGGAGGGGGGGGEGQRAGGGRARAGGRGGGGAADGEEEDEEEPQKMDWKAARFQRMEGTRSTRTGLRSDDDDENREASGLLGRLQIRTWHPRRSGIFRRAEEQQRCTEDEGSAHSLVERKPSPAVRDRDAGKNARVEERYGLTSFHLVSPGVDALLGAPEQTDFSYATTTPASLADGLNGSRTAETRSAIGSMDSTEARPSPSAPAPKARALMVITTAPEPPGRGEPRDAHHGPMGIPGEDGSHPTPAGLRMLEEESEDDDEQSFGRHSAYAHGQYPQTSSSTGSRSSHAHSRSHSHWQSQGHARSHPTSPRSTPTRDGRVQRGLRSHADSRPRAGRPRAHSDSVPDTRPKAASPSSLLWPAGGQLPGGRPLPVVFVPGGLDAESGKTSRADGRGTAGSPAASSLRSAVSPKAKEWEHVSLDGAGGLPKREPKPDAAAAVAGPKPVWSARDRASEEPRSAVYARRETAGLAQKPPAHPGHPSRFSEGWDSSSAVSTVKQRGRERKGVSFERATAEGDEEGATALVAVPQKVYQESQSCQTYDGRRDAPHPRSGSSRRSDDALPPPSSGHLNTQQERQGQSGKAESLSMGPPPSALAPAFASDRPTATSSVSLRRFTLTPSSRFDKGGEAIATSAPAESPFFHERVPLRSLAGPFAPLPTTTAPISTSARPRPSARPLARYSVPVFSTADSIFMSAGAQRADDSAPFGGSTSVILDEDGSMAPPGTPVRRAR